MSLPDDLYLQPEQFSGRVRVFPLPGLVLFPHVLQPLHIFEPRYRQLLEAALADDQLIALALPEPGAEHQLAGRPPLLSTACLGRVVNHQRLDDGRYNILLAGLERVRLVGELPRDRLPADQLFREFHAEPWFSIEPADDDPQRTALHQQLVAALRRALPGMPSAQEQLEQLLQTPMPLGTLTDILGYTVNLETETKYELLAERSAAVRAHHLLSLMNAPPSTTRPFPPEFSDN